jgi:hypothetical protein
MTAVLFVAGSAMANASAAQVRRPTTTVARRKARACRAMNPVTSRDASDSATDAKPSSPR